MLVQMPDYPVKQVELTAKPITVKEFEAFLHLPENRDRLLELIHGRIVEKMPTEEHGTIALTLGSVIRAYVKQHQLGRVGVEIRHGLSKDQLNSRMPDVSFISGKRAVVTEGAVPQMPDFAIEVRSPDDSIKAMREKAHYYLANGAALVWLVFPHKRYVEVYTPDHEMEVCFGDDRLTGGDVLSGFSMAVTEIFADL
jgi:Uma2 family endonuclease